MHSLFVPQISTLWNFDRFLNNPIQCKQSYAWLRERYIDRDPTAFQPYLVAYL